MKNRCTLLALLILLAAGSQATAQTGAANPRWTLYGVGDSLAHGTMDASNNRVHTANAFMELLARSLDDVTQLRFVQPFFDFSGERLQPFRLPTNFGVDGADVFSIEGVEYYKRVGAVRSFLTSDYLADQFLPASLSDDYDRVLFPANLLARRPLSQVGAAEWSFALNALSPAPRHEAVVVWIGNNDSSLATLGSGGANPSFLAIPYEETRSRLSSLLVTIVELAQSLGAISFEPYSAASIDRNMTEQVDFWRQARRALSRIANAPPAAGVTREIFVLTLPYYTAVGYLFDSEDLEYYLTKIDPTYSVPPTFARVAPVGQPIEDPFAGDRVSLLTFGFMQALLSTGASVAEVNSILEQNGQQRDGLVLSEAEQRRIMIRTDQYNVALRTISSQLGARVHLVDVGAFLVDALTGETPISVGGMTLSRKWVRGGALSLDGVHPGYTGQAVIADFVLDHLNRELGLAAPAPDVEQILLGDPYIDRDGDGFAPGPDHPASGLTELLYLLRDPDDTDPMSEAVLPPNVWDLISNVLVGEVLRVPAVREEALRRGLPIGSGQ